MITKTCLSCLQSVSSLAQRCPHCTTELSLIGGQPRHHAGDFKSSLLGLVFFLCLGLAMILDSSTIVAISLVIIGLMALVI